MKLDIEVNVYVKNETVPRQFTITEENSSEKMFKKILSNRGFVFISEKENIMIPIENIQYIEVL